MNKLEDSSSVPEALPDWIVECLSRLFSSISDHTRIRIVRDRAMLQATREGRSVYYSLADDHLRALIKTGVQHAYQDCTNNLRREAESRTDG